MPLTLTITSYQNRASAGNTTTIVESGSITIGRAPDNDWVLPDPEMVLSRKHCRISYQNGNYFVTDTSVNGVFINQSEERLGKGNTARLNQGDEFTLGDYTIRATIIDGKVQVVSNANNNDQDDALLNDIEDAPSYEALSTAPIEPATAPAPASAPITKPKGQKDQKNQSGVIGEEHDPRSEAKPFPKPTTDEIPNFDAISSKTSNGDVSEVVTEAKPPFNLDQAALQAFLDGVGVAKLPVKDDDLPELMYLLGVILRQTVEGMMDVLRTRTEIKQELKINKTMLTPVKNNPLKWQPNAEEALYALLSNRGEVWMSPQEAIRDGFEDIRLHESAMNAGVKSAFKRFLETIDPEQFEQELQESSKLDFLTGNRRGKYWDAFKKHYRKIAEVAGGEFQDILNKEIADAYEQQQQKQKKTT